MTNKQRFRCKILSFCSTVVEVSVFPGKWYTPMSDGCISHSVCDITHLGTMAAWCLDLFSPTTHIIILPRLISMGLVQSHTNVSNKAATTLLFGWSQKIWKAFIAQVFTYCIGIKIISFSCYMTRIHMNSACAVLTCHNIMELCLKAREVGTVCQL
jgi:hypothetical protein